MREIKFRVWCKDNKEWEKDEIHMDCNGLLIHISAGRMMPLRQEGHIAMFYTGQNDDNGKEIYEGDILAIGKPCHPYGDIIRTMHQVVWDDYDMGYKLETIGRENIGEVTFSHNETMVVVGNIYENSELLEVKNATI